MITKEELLELKWEHEDHWYSYPIKHTTHSNEYFDENGNLICFPYYSLHPDSRPNNDKFWIQDPDGTTIFTGRIGSKEDMEAIMRSLIDYTYMSNTIRETTSNNPIPMSILHETLKKDNEL